MTKRLQILLFSAFFCTFPFVLFAQTPFSIKTKAGKSHLFNVEVAITAEQRSNGLMFREKLAEDGGMLFINQEPQPMAMWMKNTLIPLDILFINRDNTIFHIHHNAIPHSQELLLSKGEAKAALEIAGGIAKKLGISEGDLVYYLLPAGE